MGDWPMVDVIFKKNGLKTSLTMKKIKSATKDNMIISNHLLMVIPLRVRFFSLLASLLKGMFIVPMTVLMCSPRIVGIRPAFVVTTKRRLLLNFLFLKAVSQLHFAATDVKNNNFHFKIAKNNKPKYRWCQ